MGRLKGRELPSRIGKATSRLQRKDKDEAARHRRRDAEKSWRSWQKTARWQKLRLKIRRRDAVDISDRPDLIPMFVLFPGAPWLWPRCQKTGVILMGRHPAPDSPVADHILPHRGDPGLFWDEANLQTVSKAWHDREKQKREHAAGL